MPQDNSIYQTPLGQQAVELAKDIAHFMMVKGLMSGRTLEEEAAVALLTAEILLQSIKAAHAEMGIDTNGNN